MVFDPSYYYLYSYSKSGYRPASFTLSPPRDNNYDITMAYSLTYNTYVPVAVVGSMVFDNDSSLLSFSYVSSDNSLSNYSYTVSKIVNSRNIVLCSESSSLLSDDFSCDLSGYSGSIYVQGVVDNQIFFGDYVFISSSESLFANLDDKEAAFFTAILVAIIIFGGLFFGVAGTLLSGVAALFIGSILGIFSLLTSTMVVVVMVVSVVIILGLKEEMKWDLMI